MRQLLFGFSGAIGRESYLQASLVVWFVGHAALGIYAVTAGDAANFESIGAMLDHPGRTAGLMAANGDGLIALAAGALWGLYAWAIAALSAKRLHDLNQSGWGAAFIFVPVLGVCFWMVLCALRVPQPRAFLHHKPLNPT